MRRNNESGVQQIWSISKRASVLILSMSISQLPFWAHASEVGCKNLRFFRLQIVQRLEPGVYEVVTPAFPPFGRQHAILKTIGDKFKSAGYINDDVWVVDFTDSRYKDKLEMAMNNGFSKEFQLIRETEDCTRRGAQIEKRKAEERAIAAEQEKEQRAKEEEAERLEKQKQEKKRKEREKLWE